MTLSGAVQQLFDAHQQFAAVEQENQRKQDELPQQPQGRLKQHERGLHRSQEDGAEQPFFLPAHRHKPPAVNGTVQEQGDIADERRNGGARTTVTRNQQRVERDVDATV